MTAVHEFLFALELSDEALYDTMLADVARVVFGHVGCEREAELRDELRAALKAGQAKGQRRCDVRFTAHAGELLIVVRYSGGAEWRITRRIP